MEKITSIDQLDFDKTYTYADYLTWQFKERVELWRGRIAKMAPAPNRRHQRISMEMTRQLSNYLYKKKCQVYAAPFDVRLLLPEEKQKKSKINTVVQPDICVVCDLDKLDEQGCNGAPDLVIEILSPGNTKREMKDKYRLYEAAGVLEYWLVDPQNEWIIVYTLNKEGVYQGSKTLVEEEEVRSTVLSEMNLRAEDIFVQ